MKKISLLPLLGVAILSLTACDDSVTTIKSSKQIYNISNSTSSTVTLHYQNYGTTDDITVSLTSSSKNKLYTTILSGNSKSLVFDGVIVASVLNYMNVTNSSGDTLYNWIKTNDSYLVPSQNDGFKKLSLSGGDLEYLLTIK